MPRSGMLALSMACSASRSRAVPSLFALFIAVLAAENSVGAYRRLRRTRRVDRTLADHPGWEGVQRRRHDEEQPDKRGTRDAEMDR